MRTKKHNLEDFISSDNVVGFCLGMNIRGKQLSRTLLRCLMRKRCVNILTHVIRTYKKLPSACPPNITIYPQPSFGRRLNPLPLTNDADLSCILVASRISRTTSPQYSSLIFANIKSFMILESFISLKNNPPHGSQNHPTRQDAKTRCVISTS